MKNLREKLLTAGMISLLLLASTTIFAQRGQGFKHGQCCPGFNTEECRIPDLTQDQQDEIKALRTAHWEAMQEYRTDMRILREEMDDLTSGSDYDAKAANKKIEEISSLKEKMMKARLAHRSSVRNLLTDEQKVVFDNHRPGRGMGFGRGHGPHGRRGPGPFNCPNGRSSKWQ